MTSRAAFAASRAMAVLCLACSPALRGADQPQWGERFTRNMVSRETGLPVSFNLASGANVKWSAALGSETHATPVVAGGRVYIGTNNNVPRDPRHRGDRGVLMCFDEQSGRLLWQLIVPKITTSKYWDWPNSGLCSPVVVEGDRVYAVTNRGEIVCLDAAGMSNGNQGWQDEARHQSPADEPPVEVGPTDADILWRYDLIGELGVRQHDSAHASPLLYGEHLYVNTSNGVDDTHRHIASPDAPSLVVLDKRTGRLVATDAERIGPRIFHCTWSSPALAGLPEQPRIVFCGGDGIVYGFEPVAAGGRADTTARLHKVWQFDPDPTAPKEDVHRFVGNRKESPSNVKGMPVIYRKRVYVTVGGDLWWGKNQAWLKCIDATGTGDATRSAERWSYPLERHAMTTPAIHDGLVFVGDSGRRIHCVDAETGQPRWTHDVKGEVWASPLVADGRVYWATRRGEFLVFAASGEKQLLGQAQFEGPISSTPVAANGVLYVATMTRLYALAVDRNQAQPPSRLTTDAH